MTKKTANYSLIHHFKHLPDSTAHPSILAARHGHYDKDINNPYYLIDIPLCVKPLLILGQNFHCEEQHITFFANKDSDLHYTGIFTANGIRYKLHAFLRHNHEGENIPITFCQIDPWKDIVLTPKDLFESVQYAVWESAETLQRLENLGQEHQNLISQQEAIYTKQQIIYRNLVFGEAQSLEAQLECVRIAKAAVQQLLALASENNAYQRKYKTVLSVEAAIVKQTQAKSHDQLIEVEINQNNNSKVITAPPTPSYEAFNKSEQIASKEAKKKRNKIREEWSAFVKKFREMQELVKHIPNPIVSSEKPGTFPTKLNPDYLRYLEKLVIIHQSITEKYLFLPDLSEIIKIEDRTQLNSEFNLLDNQFQEAVAKGITNILYFGKESDASALQTLCAVHGCFSKINAKVLIFIIKENKAQFLMILLEQHISLNFVLSIPERTNTLHGTSLKKSILEIIIAENAKNCLSAVVEKYPLDLLALASDGKPLACYILRLDPSNDFRQHCFDKIPALQSPRFYERLIDFLITQGDEESVLLAQIEMSACKRSIEDSFAKKILGEDLSAEFGEISAAIPPREFARLRAIGFYKHENSKYLDQLAQTKPNLALEFKKKFGLYFASKTTINAAEIKERLKDIQKVSSNPICILFWHMFYKATAELYKFLNLNMEFLNNPSVNPSERAIQIKLSSFYFDRFIKLDTFLNMPAREGAALKAMNEQIDKLHEKLKECLQRPEGDKQAILDLQAETEAFNAKLKEANTLKEEQKSNLYSLRSQFLAVLDDHPYLFSEIDTTNTEQVENNTETQAGNLYNAANEDEKDTDNICPNYSF